MHKYVSLRNPGLFTRITALLFLVQAWVELMDRSDEETDSSQIARNCEAQHRYLTWRSEKVGIVVLSWVFLRQS